MNSHGFRKSEIVPPIRAARDGLAPMSGTRIALWLAISIAVVLPGCGDDDGGPTNPQVIAVTLAPGEIVLPTEGAVMQLTVTAQTTEAPRDVTADPATSYTSANTSVASVVAGGEVIANGIGETTIVASNGGFSDTATVSVDTLAAIAISGVAVTPESVTMTSLGQTRATTTTITWANGAELRSLSGPPIVYATTNDTVAGVDAAGVITALADGAAIVTASFAGRSDSIAVAINSAAFVSFSQTVLPRFTTGPSRCTDSQCHPGTGPAQRNLRMNSYANITSGNSDSGDSVVIPGNGTGSLLVRVLRGDVAVPATPQMPDTRPKFTSAVIDTIQLWIDQGALDN
jgi:hypothetical protein